jgi:hypothetical protein
MEEGEEEEDAGLEDLPEDQYQALRLKKFGLNPIDN